VLNPTSRKCIFSTSLYLSQLDRSFSLATWKILKHQNKPKTSYHNKAKGLLVADEQNAPAMFFFGDSGFNVGNNNHLFTLIKSNFPPFGIDFMTKQPTSRRFYNGKITSDFAGSSFSNSPIQSFSFFLIFFLFISEYTGLCLD
jgi:hypothetical protein